MSDQEKTTDNVDGLLTSVTKAVGRPTAAAIRGASGVEHKDDTYAGFILTSCELVNPKTDIHPLMAKQLKGDPRFSNEKDIYLLTVVQEQPSGELRQRKFAATKNDLQKIGLDNEKVPMGDGKSILLDDKLSIETHGQYLESIGIFGKSIPLMKVYPRIQSIEATDPIHPEEKKRVEQALRDGRVNKNLVIGWASKRMSPPAPTP